MDLFVELAQYGSVGIALALIILMGILIRSVFIFMGNHSKHNTEALTKLNEKIKQDIEIGKETHKLLRNLNERR